MRVVAVYDDCYRRRPVLTPCGAEGAGGRVEPNPGPEIAATRQSLVRCKGDLSRHSRLPRGEAGQPNLIHINSPDLIIKGYWGIAVVITLLILRAFFNQKLHNIIIPLHPRNTQGRCAIIGLSVHIRTFIKQGIHDPAMADRCIQRINQGRHTMIVFGVHIRTFIKQGIHDFAMAVFRCPHQGRFAKIISRVHIRTFIKQGIHDFAMAVFRCPHQGRFAIIVLGVHVKTSLQQFFNFLNIAFSGSIN